MVLSRPAILALLCAIPIVALAQKQEPFRGTLNAISPVPNYSKGSRSIDPAFLTDGKYSKSAILWLDPATLGWERVPQITIDIALERVSTIGAITLHTGTNPPAEVYLPLTIHVFASLDKETFQYMGDMMAEAPKAGDGYQEIKLALSGMAVKAKYLRLIVLPGGMFFFTDEIEIFPSKNGRAIRRPLQTLDASEIEAFINSEKGITKERRFLLKDIDDKLKVANGTHKQQLYAIRDRINKDLNLSRPGRYERYRREIAAASVTEKVQKGLVIKRNASPWSEDLGKSSERGASGWSAGATVQLLSCVNASEYVAFSVFNNTSAELNATVGIESDPDLDMGLYHAGTVKTRDFMLPPDVLVPVGNGGDLKFYPGETKIFITAVKPGKQGMFSAAIRLSGGGKVAELKLSAKVLKPVLAFQADKRLNIDVWAYFHEPFLKGRETLAREDLLDHYVNTFVIPQHVSLSALVNDDFRMLDRYLKNLKGFEKVLLFMNFRDYLPTVEGYYMNPNWKKKFLAGYDKVVKILHDNGIRQDNIYLYPFDEVTGKEVESYLAFADWIHSERKSAQIFTTVINEHILSRIKGRPDIVQLYRGENILKDADVAGEKETWLYDIMNNSKAVPPYSRYRLLGWKAFDEGMEGVGFWAYGDVRGDNEATAWDDFDGNTGDYTVVYEQGNTILPSRRWEAFKAGIEDYMLLSMFAENFGEKGAKTLSGQVLSKPDDYTLADKIRVQMIKKLAEIK